MRRVRGSDGSGVWQALAPCAGGGNATVTGLAVSEAAGLVVLAVEHPPDGAGELLLLDLATGGVVGGSCLLHPAATAAPATRGGGPAVVVRLRGLALDDLTTPPTVFAAALDQDAASAQVAAARVVAARVAGGAGGGCAVARSVPLTQGDGAGGGVAPVPFRAPLRAPTSGLTTDAWPSLLVGPLAGQLAVVLPGVGVVTVR